MKKLISLAMVIALMLALAACGSNGGGGSGGSSSQTGPTLEANGRTLALPCTLDELLEFGFTLESIGEFVDGPFATGVDDLVRLERHSEPRLTLQFTDGSKFIVTFVTPNSREEVRLGEFIFTSIQDYLSHDEVIGGLNDRTGALQYMIDNPSTLIINGIAKTDSLERADDIFSDFYRQQPLFQAHYHLNPEDSEPFVFNGYTVNSIYITIDDFDGGGALWRHMALNGVRPVE